MKCPFCKQDFSDNVAEIHIPWCKEQKEQKKQEAAARSSVNTGENKAPDDGRKNKSEKNANAVGNDKDGSNKQTADPASGTQDTTSPTSGDSETK
jgi:hypothetical protein